MNIKPVNFNRDPRLTAPFDGAGNMLTQADWYNNVGVDIPATAGTGPVTDINGRERCWGPDYIPPHAGLQWLPRGPYELDLTLTGSQWYRNLPRYTWEDPRTGCTYGTFQSDFYAMLMTGRIRREISRDGAYIRASGMWWVRKWGNRYSILLGD